MAVYQCAKLYSCRWIRFPAEGGLRTRRTDKLVFPHECLPAVFYFSFEGTVVHPYQFLTNPNAQEIEDVSMTSSFNKAWFRRLLNLIYRKN